MDDNWGYPHGTPHIGPPWRGSRVAESRSMAGRALAGGLLCVLIAVDGLAPGALTWGPSGWETHSHGCTMLVKGRSQKRKKGKPVLNSLVGLLRLMSGALRPARVKFPLIRDASSKVDHGTGFCRLTCRWLTIFIRFRTLALAIFGPLRC